MWYFSWLLGLPLAAAFAVLNAMWYELMDDEAQRRDKLARPAPGEAGQQEAL
ncbi:cytochrome bd-I oxidase subunit CydX [Pseudorhodoferax sp. LjRoot39]|jgi:cyd operon protein YbgT|uniref:cytochrome bd-I oxidase subunit CydX n=1 Tax=Pseudorhodoferax sp. LjRoot39 TaxID=3342328 RepID=UPI003ECCF201